MDAGPESFEAAGDERPVVYCLVPEKLASALHDTLQRHFRDEPGVEVIVERREAERRNGAERRAAEGEGPQGAERRRVLGASGRRVGDRRSPLVAVHSEDAPELPRRARKHAGALAFVRRLEPTSQQQEDRDTERIVLRVQAGDREAFGTIYLRYFDRVYSYMRVVVRDRDEADDATQEVFVNALAALPEYESRGRPFRHWLFTLARNEGLGRLRAAQREELMDPHMMEELAEAEGEAGGEAEQAVAAVEEGEEPDRLEVLDWITDRDLVLFVERLPVPQRQVLALRYLMDMSTAQTAETLGRNHASVRTLQHRALRYLEERLRAIGRGPRRAPRAKMTRAPQQSGVLRLRRFALH